MRSAADVVTAGGPVADVAGRRAADAAGMSDDGVLSALDAAFVRRREVDAEIVSLTSEVVDRSRSSLGTDGLASRLGETSAAAVIASVGRIAVAEARRLCRVGEATRARMSLIGEVMPPIFPSIAVSLAAGRIGVDAAAHIVASLTQAAPRAVVEDLMIAEEALVDFAGSHPTDLVRALAARYRDALDTDGVEPREDELVAGRSLRRTLLPNGLKRFQLDLDPLSAAHLDASIDAVVGAAISRVRFDDLASPPGDGEVPDPRTLTQIGADAIVDLARHSNACTNTQVPAPSVTVIMRIPFDSLLTGLGTATIDGCDSPVSATTARLLAERDGGCAFPTCDRFPTWTEAHHIRWWSHDGPTDLNNGVLLCTRHHHTVHTYGWGIDLRRNIPWFIPPPTIDPHRTPRRGGRLPEVTLTG